MRNAACAPLPVSFASQNIAARSTERSLHQAKIVVKGDEICECTEDGVECEELSNCPEFVRMDSGAKRYSEAKVECEALGGHVAFFKDQSEFDKFMGGFKRKEHIGRRHSNSDF